MWIEGNTKGRCGWKEIRKGAEKEEITGGKSEDRKNERRTKWSNKNVEKEKVEKECLRKGSEENEGGKKCY